MPTKNEVYESVEDRIYTQKEVKALIHSIKETNKGAIYGDIRKYDVFVSRSASNKSRPFVVLKVFGNRVLALGMSTTQDYMNMIEFEDRIFGKGFFNLNVIVFETEFVKTNFIGVFEETKKVNDCIKLIKETINKL